MVIGSRYELDEVIGEKSISVVYRGCVTDSQDTVTIKAMKLSDISPDAINCLRSQWEILGQINHPNIVKPLDIIQENDTLYVVTEYVQGSSLSALIGQRPRQSINRILQITLNLADALASAHRVDVVHHNIQPDSVLIAADGAPRLTDFDKVCLGVSPISSQALKTSEVDAAGYLSPEQLNRESINASSDIRALGAVLYHMLIGKPAFTGNDLHSLTQSIMTAPLPNLEVLRPDTPPELASLIYHMLVKNPAERLSSMELVRAEMDALLRIASRTMQPEIPHNMPAPTTPFVGRERELVDLQGLLSDPQTRLVTILAPGGMGKTRVALETAGYFTMPSERNGNYQFPDGVFCVELAPVDDVDNILNAIAETIGFTFQGSRERKKQLVEFLRPQKLLLVLDNFEQLRAGAVMLSDILNAASQVKVLVTSREKLALSAEVIYALLGMDYPTGPRPQDVADFTAVKLFRQRAKRVYPDFELPPSDYRHVARICQLVEGMPLGIELAAAWANVLSLAEIADEITRSLDFLDAEHQDLVPRQWSMRAVIDYSWNRLADLERRYLITLSIFRGGFMRHAAESVANIDLRSLRSLTDKSLISRNSAGRYNIHELLRRYAQEKLDELNLAAELNAAHCDYFAEFMRQRKADLEGKKQLTALTEIRTDFDNIWAAWHWAVHNKHYTAIEKMLDALYASTFISFDGERFFRYGLTHLSPDDGDLSLRVWAELVVRSWYLLDSPQENLQKALHILQQYDSNPFVATCLHNLGWLAYDLDQDCLAAIGYFEQSLPLYFEQQNQSAQADVYNNIGVCRSRLGQINVALEIYEKALALTQQIGDQVHELVAQSLIGENCLIKGNFAGARRNFESAAKVTRALASRWGLAWTVSHLGLLSLLGGDLEHARAHSREAMALAALMHHVRDIKPARTLAGLIAILDGDYDSGWRLCEGLDRGENAYGFIIATIARIGLAMAACGLQDYDVARQQLTQVLKYVVFSPCLQLWCLLIGALLVSRHGEKAWAVELLGLVVHHPANPKGLIERWPQLVQLQKNLQQEMGSPTYVAALARGGELDIRKTRTDLIKWLDNFQQMPDLSEVTASSQVHFAATEESLVEALSKRELEVLRFLAAGLSNRQIADRMVVDVSTVKKHLTHIYEKMGIASRTQAVVVAQQLNLL